MKFKNKRQFGLAHIDENGFTINPYNPKNVILNEKCVTCYDNDGIVNT